MMMMTFTEVKGHQRSDVVNYVLWLPNLVRRIPIQVYDDDDLHEGQRSSEVKCDKLCSMATKLGSKESLMQVYDDDDLHGGQRSSEVKGSELCAMVTKRSEESLMQV